MQVRSDSLISSQMRLGLANTEGLKLFKGEIVQAIIEKVIGEGLFQVNIKGMTVEAATELMLTAGQSLLLRSEGSVDGRQILRVVKPDEEYSLKVATLLQEMGYKADDRLIAITAKLMQYGLPLNRENIEHVMIYTRWLGEFNPLNLETAVWALAGRLKASPEFLNAIRSFLAAPESIKPLLQQMLQSLSTARPTVGDSRAASQPVPIPLPTNGASQANNVSVANRIYSSGITNGADDAATMNRMTDPDTANRIEGATTTSRPEGIGTANRLDGAAIMGRPDGIDTQNRLDGSNIMGRLDGGLTENAILNQRFTAIEGLFKAIESVINLHVTGDPETIKGELQRVIGSNKEIIRALAVIQEMLNRFPDTVRQVGGEVLQLMQSVEGELLGQAAFNSAETQLNNQQPGFYYFAIPLEVAGQNRVMELRIYKDDRGTRRLDELEEIRLAVALDTATLGMVVFHVTFKKDSMLEIQGVVNNLVSKEIIERDISVLQQRLVEHGYNVYFWGMKVTSEPERLRPGFQTKEFESPVLGIDITV